jgi:hypothetical protein
MVAVSPARSLLHILGHHILGGRVGRFPLVPTSFMTDNTPQLTSNTEPHGRWKFMRNVAVFQFKLLLNNLHNFVQAPLTFIIALVDLIFKTEPEGARFYKLLEYGRTIDESIDIYSVVAHRQRCLNADYTVDSLVSKLEGVIIREYDKGGSAASIKAAVDRAMDELQARAGEGKDKAASTIRSAVGKMREKMQRRERARRPTAPALNRTNSTR